MPIRDLQEFVGPFDYVNLPRTFQASIGFQRQLGDTMSFEADYVYSRAATKRMSSRTSTCHTTRPQARTILRRTEPCVPIPIGASSR